PMVQRWVSYTARLLGICEALSHTLPQPGPAISGLDELRSALEETRARLFEGETIPVKIDAEGRVFRPDGTEVLDIGMSRESLLEALAEADSGASGKPLEEFLAEQGL